MILLNHTKLTSLIFARFLLGFSGGSVNKTCEYKKIHELNFNKISSLSKAQNILSKTTFEF